MSDRVFHRSTIEVFVYNWEIECCAPPPVVGEPTTWTLGFCAETGPSTGRDRDRSWLVSPRGGWTAVQDGPVVAYWNEHCGAAPEPGRHALRGCLTGTMHGLGPEGVPPTTGIVRRVRLATEMCRSYGDGEFRPVAGSLELVDVPRSPRRFSQGGLPVEPGVDKPAESGVLLDVTVE